MILLNPHEVAYFNFKNMLYVWKIEELKYYMLKLHRRVIDSYQTTKLLCLLNISTKKCAPTFLEMILKFFKKKKSQKPKTPSVGFSCFPS